MRSEILIDPHSPTWEMFEDDYGMGVFEPTLAPMRTVAIERVNTYRLGKHTVERTYRVIRSNTPNTINTGDIQS